MLRRFLLGILVVSLASLAWAGVPDLVNSEITIPDGVASAHMSNTPLGGGSSFDEAYGVGGAVDATITLLLIDLDGNPIFLFPLADLWLETNQGSLQYCNGGTVADGSTDVNGETTWSNALFAGGYTLPGEATRAMIAGAPLVSTVPISHNSPDISGDLQVNSTDNTFFAQLLFENYTNNPLFAGDYDNSGTINLTDITLYTRAIGDVCN